MRFIEIKIFNYTDEAISFKNANENINIPYDLMKICYATINFDKIIGFFPDWENPNVTILDVEATEHQYLLPMTYDKFKEFFKNKMLD